MAVTTPRTEHAPADLDEAWESFFGALRRARTRYSDDDGAGLSLSQYALLAGLLHAPALPMGELAAQAGVAAPTATRALDALVRRGLAVREASPSDRRVVVVRLTSQGEQAVRDKRTALRRRRAQLLRTFDPAEREQARVLLLRLAGLMDEIA